MLCLNRFYKIFVLVVLLIIPCEVASKSVIPALRAMIARELIEGYGLKQEQVAMKLGVTQAAVSKYRHQVRGEAVELEAASEVQAMSKAIALMLSQSLNPLAV